jgi:hypothetical protein
MSDETIPTTLTERFPDLSFAKVEGASSWVGVDSDGEVHVSACSRRGSQPDPTRAAQDAMETGSQVVGADDEWA